VPAICFGPQPELASGIDDYVREQDLIDCAKIYALSALAYLNA
jgi:succinyl-diaminopimelate desuccinylase